jgi:hypothetical protein
MGNMELKIMYIGKGIISVKTKKKRRTKINLDTATQAVLKDLHKQGIGNIEETKPKPTK